jgi:hypothetical protein
MALESLIYRAADGRSVWLTDYSGAQGWVVTARRGFDAPPQRAVTEALPGLAGARYTGALRPERALALTLEVLASSFVEARQRVAQLAAVLMQPGRFEATANGQTRVLDAVYNGGLEGDTASRRGATYVFTPEWRAPNPYWYEPTPRTLQLLLAQAPTGIVFPASFPLFFGVAGQTAQCTLQGGDVPSPWQALVQGPCSGAVFAKLRTGERLALPGLAVGPGQVLRVENIPGQRRLVLDNGWVTRDVVGYLTPDSAFWLLDPGPTTVAVQILNGPQAVITFTWQPYYLGEA